MKFFFKRQCFNIGIIVILHNHSVPKFIKGVTENLIFFSKKTTYYEHWKGLKLKKDSAICEKTYYGKY